MRRLKIYLDTSVISYLRQEDAPEKMKDTLEFWGIVKDGQFNVFISDLTVDELSECSEPKRRDMFVLMEEIEYTKLSLTAEIETFAKKFIEHKILSPKSFDDCLHLAFAVISDCDYIVSWNFKHIVNVKTINGVRAINCLSGYKPIDIVTPPMLLGGGIVSAEAED